MSRAGPPPRATSRTRAGDAAARLRPDWRRRQATWRGFEARPTRCGQRRPTLGLERLAELAGLMESEFGEASRQGAVGERRQGQLRDAAEAFAEGARVAAEGREEPAEMGRSFAQLFGVR